MIKSDYGQADCTMHAALGKTANIQIDPTFYDEPQERMEMHQHILEGPCPCDSCPLIKQCAEKIICCEDFLVYTQHEIVQSVNRVPSKWWMKRIETTDSRIVMNYDDRIEIIRIAVQRGTEFAIAASGATHKSIARWIKHYWREAGIPQ